MMKTIKIKQFRDFQNDFEYDLLCEIQTLKNNSFKFFNVDVINKSKEILKQILNSNRKKVTEILLYWLDIYII